MGVFRLDLLPEPGREHGESVEIDDAKGIQLTDWWVVCVVDSGNRREQTAWPRDRVRRVFFRESAVVQPRVDIAGH